MSGCRLSAVLDNFCHSALPEQCSPAPSKISAPPLMFTVLPTEVLEPEPTNECGRHVLAWPLVISFSTRKQLIHSNIKKTATFFFIISFWIQCIHHQLHIMYTLVKYKHIQKLIVCVFIYLIIFNNYSLQQLVLVNKFDWVNYYVHQSWWQQVL